MTTIIVVGGADTGRAPLAAALLRRRLIEQARDWRIESAGVLGHDGDTWQPETRLAMENLNLTPHEHLARSLTAEMADAADLLITVDRGVGRAIELQFPTARWRALPDMAGTEREVPDPFRMTMDAWIIYGRELDAQLKAALPTIVELVRGQESGIGNRESGIGEPATGHRPPTTDHRPPTTDHRPPTTDHRPPATDTHAPSHRLAILVRGIAGLPELIDWGRARAAIRETLQVLAGSVHEPGDLRPAAVAMLLGVLGADDAPLSATQLAILSDAADQLAHPIDGAGLGALGGAIGRWGS
jgi:protein-tyrosine phosphatase